MVTLKNERKVVDCYLESRVERDGSPDGMCIFHQGMEGRGLAGAKTFFFFHNYYMIT